MTLEARDSGPVDERQTWAVTRVTRLKRRRLRYASWLGWLVGTPVLFAAFAALMLSAPEALLAAATAAVTYLPPLIVTGAPFLAWLARRDSVNRLTAEMHDDGIYVVRGQSVRERIDWNEVALIWQPYPLGVQIFTYGGDEIEIYVPHHGRARELVHAIRARYERRAYSIALEGETTEGFRKLGSWALALWAGSVPFAFGALPGVLGLTTALAVGWWLTRARPSIEFGADGVAIKGRFKKRFIAYRDIERVETRAGIPPFHVMLLVLKDGKRIRVRATHATPRARLLKALVEEGMQMAANGRAAGAEVPDLVREEKSPQAYRERLERLTREVQYRTKAVTPEQLLGLMRNPAADPDQRAAAALALRSNPTALPRIRVAAEVTADPDVKAALEELSGDDFDETRLERVLVRLSRPAR
jgi:hypothetical protein